MKTDDPTFINVFGFAKEYIETKYQTFTSEDVRIAFEKLNPEIIFSNYGGVMNSLQRSGLIIEKGSAKAKLTAAKGRRIIKYISSKYSKQQSKNRQKNPIAEIDNSQVILNLK